MVVRFDPMSAAFNADPYPTYAALRAEDPVHFSPATGAWVISRYDDVVRVLRDYERFSSHAIGGGMGQYRFLIGTDPPDHTTLRRLVNRPFHPAAIAALEPRIREICNGLVEELIAANRTGEADLIQHVGYPLPVIVIAELMGIPPERRDDFKRWSDAMLGGLSPDADRGAQAAASMEMFAYFNEAVAERRGQPVDDDADLISLLVNGPEALSNQELLMFCMLLLVAGNETTTNLISNLYLALFESPDIAERLAAERELIPRAIEEALRYDAPVQCLFRNTTADVELGGKTIPADSRVVVLYASANRDEDHYKNSDAFDVERFNPKAGPSDHVAFGSGIHLCLGAPLARLEARVVTDVLLDRTSDLRRNGDGNRIHNLLVRGMRHLPVTFTSVT